MSSAEQDQPGTRVALDDGRITIIIGSVGIIAYTLAKALADHLETVLYWPAAFLLDLLRDLGIAFVVGGIVSLGIERISRRKFLTEARVARERFFAEVGTAHQTFLTSADDKIREVKQNFFNAAVLRQYPEGYSEAVLETLAASKYFKTGINVVVDIIPVPPGHCRPFADCVLHEQTSSYHALNVTREVLTIQPKLFLDVDWDGCPAELLEWRVGDVHLRETDLRGLKTIERADGSDGPFIWYQFPKPVSVQPGESRFVLAHVRTVKHERDTTTWCGLQPADSLRFTVNHPREFEAYIQQKTAARSVEGAVKSDGKRVMVEIFKPLMPYMTMEYGWRPVPRPGSLL